MGEILKFPANPDPLLAAITQHVGHLHGLDAPHSEIAVRAVAAHVRVLLAAGMLLGDVRRLVDVAIELAALDLE